MPLVVAILTSARLGRPMRSHGWNRLERITS
jgi:hypothetical protein